MHTSGCFRVITRTNIKLLLKLCFDFHKIFVFSPEEWHQDTSINYRGLTGTCEVTMCHLVQRMQKILEISVSQWFEHWSTPTKNIAFGIEENQEGNMEFLK